VNFHHGVEDVVEVVEGIGVGVLVLGSLFVLARSVVWYLIPAQRGGAYHYARRHLGRTILLGLEILIVSDIIKTVILQPTLGSVAVLGTIVLIRIVLSWSLAVEIDGVWPWRRYETVSRGPQGPDGGS
jgi:uncharacterized membrane protein